MRGRACDQGGPPTAGGGIRVAARHGRSVAVLSSLRFFPFSTDFSPQHFDFGSSAYNAPPLHRGGRLLTLPSTHIRPSPLVAPISPLTTPDHTAWPQTAGRIQPAVWPAQAALPSSPRNAARKRHVCLKRRSSAPQISCTRTPRRVLRQERNTPKRAVSSDSALPPSSQPLVRSPSGEGGLAALRCFCFARSARVGPAGLTWIVHVLSVCVRHRTTPSPRARPDDRRARAWPRSPPPSVEGAPKFTPVHIPPPL